jgi:hypothetical protein
MNIPLYLLNTTVVALLPLSRGINHRPLTEIGEGLGTDSIISSICAPSAFIVSRVVFAILLETALWI